jgi:hypothetical protein
MTFFFDEQYRDEIGDSMVGAIQALIASGDPRYDPSTPEGKRRLIADAQQAGNNIAFIKAFNAFVLPGQPRMEVSMNVAEDYANGDVPVEMVAVDALRQEYFAALKFFGNQEATIAYMIDRFGVDPISFTSETAEIRPRPLTKDAYDEMVRSPELRVLAPTTLMAFLPPDPNGDFFELAFNDALATGARERLNPEQVIDQYLATAGYLAVRKITAEYEKLELEAREVFGYGTEQYYARMRELRETRTRLTDIEQQRYWHGAAQPNVEGAGEPVSLETMMGELRAIGTPGSEEYTTLRERLPEYVDFLTIVDQIWETATRQSSIDNDATWWLTAEYGMEADGDVREANYIKEWAATGISDAVAQIQDPRAYDAALWAIREVISPMLTGFEDSATWVPQTVRWPQINPAGFQAWDQDTTPVPDGEPAPATVGTP